MLSRVREVMKRFEKIAREKGFVEERKEIGSLSIQEQNEVFNKVLPEFFKHCNKDPLLARQCELSIVTLYDHMPKTNTRPRRKKSTTAAATTRSNQRDVHNSGEEEKKEN
jgi:hypothetical protein